jgi:hypothetical protein
LGYFNKISLPEKWQFDPVFRIKYRKRDYLGRKVKIIIINLRPKAKFPIMGWQIKSAENSKASRQVDEFPDFQLYLLQKKVSSNDIIRWIALKLKKNDLLLFIGGRLLVVLPWLVGDADSGKPRLHIHYEERLRRNCRACSSAGKYNKCIWRRI